MKKGRTLAVRPFVLSPPPKTGGGLREDGVKLCQAFPHGGDVLLHHVALKTVTREQRVHDRIPHQFLDGRLFVGPRSDPPSCAGRRRG